MTVIITDRELKEAYAEIEAICKERSTTKLTFSDELFEFITKALGNPRSRVPNRLSYGDIAKLLGRRRWWYGTASGLAQAYLKDKHNRNSDAGK